MLNNGSNSPQFFISHSATETRQIGAALGMHLLPNSVVCFFGDLGSGKTTFIKGLASSVLGSSGEEVNSPTFTYLNIYRGNIPLYHFDLYRLSHIDEFLSMGFDEMFDAGGICCIEWAEKLSGIEIPGMIKVTMTHVGGEERRIDVYV